MGAGEQFVKKRSRSRSRPFTRTRAPSTAIAVAVLVWKKSGRARERGKLARRDDLEHDAELLRVVDRHLVPERQEYVAAVPVVEQA